jgi:hypothetical protein
MMKVLNGNGEEIKKNLLLVSGLQNVKCMYHQEFFEITDIVLLRTEEIYYNSEDITKS